MILYNSFRAEGDKCTRRKLTIQLVPTIIAFLSSDKKKNLQQKRKGVKTKLIYFLMPYIPVE
jgi:hypothetical protein